VRAIKDRLVREHALIRPRDGPGAGAGSFWMNERFEPTGALRVGLAGELDLATAGQLRDRLRALCADGRPVVLDLRRLEFIDSSGVRELVRAVSAARRDGWGLSLDTAVGPQVRRVLELLGLRDLFWPAS
jgi:anti-sigma B factor antagonist